MSKPTLSSLGKPSHKPLPHQCLCDLVAYLTDVCCVLEQICICIALLYGGRGGVKYTSIELFLSLEFNWNRKAAHGVRLPLTVIKLLRCFKRIMKSLNNTEECQTFVVKYAIQRLYGNKYNHIGSEMCYFMKQTACVTNNTNESYGNNSE